MIVHHDDAPNQPRCWNAEPIAPARVEHILNRQTGEVERVEIRNDWASKGCATWRGTGIGQPTPKYPTGTPYPIAHGWLPWCKQCRHLQAEVLA